MCLVLCMCYGVNVCKMLLFPSIFYTILIYCAHVYVGIFRLHGNMAHPVRQEVYREFARQSSCVLFCTDVRLHFIYYTFATSPTLILADIT